MGGAARVPAGAVSRLGRERLQLHPQGGGDHNNGHRCPGEWITIKLTERPARLLATAVRYDVPEQDLGIDLSRMPAKPRSRFVISNVRRTQ